MLVFLTGLRAFFTNAWALFLALPTWVKIVLLVAISMWASSMYTEYHVSKRLTAKYTKELKSMKDGYETRITMVNKAHGKAMDKQERESDELLGVLHKQLATSEARKNKKQIIIKEVTTYVTAQSDAKCIIPSGFVYVHNSTLAGEDAVVPESRPENADAPTTIKLSEVSAVVGANNAECVARGEVIKAWQDWYPKQKKIFEDAQAIINDAVKDAAESARKE